MPAAADAWVTILLLTWAAATLWALTSRNVPLVFVALQVWLLLDLVAPALSAVNAGHTATGDFDFSAGTVGALRLAFVAQGAVWAGVVLARLGLRTTPVRVSVDVAAVRLDRWMVGLVAAGVIATITYTGLVGAPLSSLNALVGGGRYGDLERAGDGVTLKALKVAGGLVGAGMLVATMRLAQGRRLGRWLAVAVLAFATVFLGLRGARLWLVLPVLASGLVWWKTSRHPAMRGGRGVLLLGALAVFAFAGIASGLRGQEAKQLDVTAFLHREATVGVFVPLAGLVDNVPARTPYLGGESYLEALAVPVPRALWGDKPDGSLREQQRTFITRDIGASVAFPGELYANAGMIAVGAGCLLFGFVLERTWLAFARTTRLEHAVVLAAVLVVLLEVFSRSNIGAQVVGQLGLVGGAWWVARQMSSSAAAAPSARSQAGLVGAPVA